jgi:hypothetical protein
MLLHLCSTAVAHTERQLTLATGFGTSSSTFQEAPLYDARLSQPAARTMSETPSKGDVESASPYQARKDKPCPFCNKPFTSSSLGRHLDLWIKEKNPKQEDGVHDVEQIRKMRGAVTRRQQKKSLGSRRYSSTSDATSAATPVATSRRSPTASEHVNSTASSLARKDSGAPAIPGFNVHNFAVTGVINNIENDAVPSTANPAREIVTQQSRVSQLNMDMARKIQDADDTARAAELALREMVSSWRAAKYELLQILSSWGILLTWNVR